MTLLFTSQGKMIFPQGSILRIAGTLVTSADADEITSNGNLSKVTLLSRVYDEESIDYHGKWQRGSVTMQNNCYFELCAEGWDCNIEYELADRTISFGDGYYGALDFTGALEDILSIFDINIKVRNGSIVCVNGAVYRPSTDVTVDNTEDLFSGLAECSPEESRNVIIDGVIEVLSDTGTQMLSIPDGVNVLFTNNGKLTLQNYTIRVAGKLSASLGEQIVWAEGEQGQICITGAAGWNLPITGGLICDSFGFFVDGDVDSYEWSNVYLKISSGEGLNAISEILLERNPTLILSGITVDQAKLWTWSGSGTVMIGETSYTITDGAWPD